MDFLLVFIGGGLGALCRFFTTTFISARCATYFPLGTLTVNVLGSFLMGLIMGVLLLLTAKTSMSLAEPARLLLTVGFLGGLTTFSSFSMETLTLIKGGSLFYALLNIGANVLFGLLAVGGGMLLARALAR